MNTVAQIIDGLGGNAAVARRLGLGASTVSEMKRRNSIPVKYWHGVMAIAQQIGAPPLTEKDLVRAHVPEAAE